MDKQPSIQVPSTQYMPRASMPSKKSPLGLMIGIVVLLLVIGGGAAYYFLVYAKKSTNANTNAAVNTNTANVNNANRNSNTSTNLNTNTASNVNTANTNSARNTNQVTNTNTPSNSNTSQLSNAADTDEDLLLNLVETWYATDQTKADTDGDGYDDNTEVAGCYDPLGTGRITTTFYQSYCARQLAWWDMTLSASAIQSLCTCWSPYAQRYIDAKINGTVVNLGGLDSACTQQMSNQNINSQYSASILNNNMLMTAGNLCNGHVFDAAIKATTP